jgi:hypothetical protein
LSNWNSFSVAEERVMVGTVVIEDEAVLSQLDGWQKRWKRKDNLASKSERTPS